MHAVRGRRRPPRVPLSRTRHDEALDPSDTPQPRSGSRRPELSRERAARWAPDLGMLRVIGGGRTLAMLRPDATVMWWCGPDVDDSPLCWQLLDPDGGAASFPGLELFEAAPSPAGASARTLLRGSGRIVQVVDALLESGSGIALVRLLRLARPGAPVTLEHDLRLGGLDSPVVRYDLDGRHALGTHLARDRAVAVRVTAAGHRLADGMLVSDVTVRYDAWSALVVAVGTGDDLPADPPSLLRRVEERDEQEKAVLDSVKVPRRHPERARDALAVLRACTYRPTGAVVAAPTTSLPEAVGHDRQFDYRYTWLRAASLGTAVAALLGQRADAQRYLAFVHRAWVVAIWPTARCWTSVAPRCRGSARMPVLRDGRLAADPDRQRRGGAASVRLARAADRSGFGLPPGRREARRRHLGAGQAAGGRDGRGPAGAGEGQQRHLGAP